MARRSAVQGPQSVGIYVTENAEPRAFRPALALLASVAWLPLAFLSPGRPSQEYGRRAMPLLRTWTRDVLLPSKVGKPRTFQFHPMLRMAGVAGSLLFDAAPDAPRMYLSSKLSRNWRFAAQAHAEEEIDFTKALRTGQTPYAKMDYQAPQSEGWRWIAAVPTEHLVAETGGSHCLYERREVLALLFGCRFRSSEKASANQHRWATWSGGQRTPLRVLEGSRTPLQGEAPSLAGKLRGGPALGAHASGPNGPALRIRADVVVSVPACMHLPCLRRLGLTKRRRGSRLERLRHSHAG